MAWSIVGVGAVAEFTTTTATLTEPAGVANGDLLIACFSSRTTATTAITNTGWTAVGSQNNNNTLTTTSALASGTMLYQVRAGTPDLTFVVPAGISVGLGRIVAYRGGAQTTPLDVSTAVTTAINTLAVSVTGLTTTQANDLIVAMAAGGQEAAWSAFNNVTTPMGASGATDTTTAPSTPWRERADSLTTTNVDTSLAVFDAVRTGTGATGNLTATASLGAGHVVIAGAFKIAPLVHKTLAADAGAYAITGTDATVINSTPLPIPAAVQYAVAGFPYSVFINETGTERQYSDYGAYINEPAVEAAPGAGTTLVADAGSYAVTGTTATLKIARKATADPGSYSIAGTAAGVLHKWKVAAPTAGSYSIGGTDASLRRVRKLVADAGAYAVTGQAAAVRHGEGLFALGGSYTIAGTTATLLHAWKPAAGVGSYSTAGQAAALTLGGGAPTGLVNVWTGSAWVQKPAKVWTGSAWMQKPVKTWNGSAWV